MPSAGSRCHATIVDMTEGSSDLDAFADAAVAWAAGGDARLLVAAAADALVAGLDTPTLRVLAGAPRATADQEAIDLAPVVFEELGLRVHDRMSTEAFVDGARHLARRFVARGGSARELARAIYRMYAAADYPHELIVWSGLDDWYDMIENGVMTNWPEADAITIEAARDLADGPVLGPALPALPAVGRRSARWSIARTFRRIAR